MNRPEWRDYFLGIANAVAARADCTRRRIGAVIVDSDHRIISTGYNGAPPGQNGCLSHGVCPRGLHYPHPTQRGVCACGMALADGLKGACIRGGVEHGSSYDTGAGSCIAVHAEANALLYARTSVQGCSLYITDAPCDGCWRLINAARLRTVYTPDDWWEV